MTTPQLSRYSQSGACSRSAAHSGHLSGRLATNGPWHRRARWTNLDRVTRAEGRTGYLKPFRVGRLDLGLGAAGLLVVASAIVLANTGPLAPSVRLKTGGFPGTAPETPGGLPIVSCYTSGIEGQLVADPDAGVAIVDGMNGRHAIITWPRGYTARRSWSEIEVIDRAGNVVARTGSHVELSGGFGPDGTFLDCGGIIPNP